MVRLIEMGEISRPATTPLQSSILDHATVGPDVASFGLRNNEGLWPSYNCLDTLVPTPICPDPSVVDGEFKTFTAAGWQPAFEFAVHGGVQCGLVALDRTDMESEVRRVFALNEGKGIERALLLNRFVASGVGAPVEWDAPTDLTPTAGSVPLNVAVALLESHAADVYAGVPTLHLPRAAVLILMGAGMIREENGKFFTKTGAKVAAGGGYDEPDMIATGEWDLYATGEVYVEKSSVINASAVTLPGDGSGLDEGQNGIGENTAIALVERMYRVAVDCFVAKATARMWT